MKNFNLLNQISKGFIIMFLLSNSCLLLHAQNPLVKLWDKRYGGTYDDVLTTFKQTNDDGYILSGYSYSGNDGDKTEPSWGQSDYWVIKIDSLGGKQWDKRFGGTANEWLTSQEQTSDGGYILGGYSNSDSSGDKTQPSWFNSIDYWIVKIDSLGNKQWDKRFGGKSYEQLYTVQQTTDGGFILGGISKSAGNGDKVQGTRGRTDYWVVKTDSLGVKQWDRRFGGTSFEYLYALQQTADGGYLLGGESASEIGGDKTQSSFGGWDYWLVKIDAAGNKLWDKAYGGINDENLFSMCKTIDGGYLLGGRSNSGISGTKSQPNWDTTNATFDYWIVKIDANGDVAWDKDFGGVAHEDEIGNVSQTFDGGYLISGSSSSPISGDKTENNLGLFQTWILKIDATGNKQWDKTLLTNSTAAYSDLGYAIQSKDGNIVIASKTPAGIGGDKSEPNWDTTNYFKDYWIVKFADSTQNNSVPAVVLTASDTALCQLQCINFTDLSTYNPTSWQWFFPGAVTTTSVMQNPTNICYNSYGNFDVTLIACNGIGCDTLLLPGLIHVFQTVAPTIVQSNDTLYASSGIAYQWYDAVNGIIAGANNNFLVPTQPGNYYVLVTDSAGCSNVSNTILITGIANFFQPDHEIKLTPNPSNGNFSIALNEIVQKDFSLSITNSLGQIIQSWQYSMGNHPFEIEVKSKNFPAGLYTVKLNNGSQVYTKKLMIN